MGRRTVVVDCSGLPKADAEQLDGIARLCLCMKRRGWTRRLADPGEELLALIELAGLAGLLGVEAGRQAEQREDADGVQEERDLRDQAP